MEMYKKGEKKKERYLVLCNDLLLICKTGFGKGRYLLTKRLSGGMFLVNSTPGESMPPLFPFLLSPTVVFPLFPFSTFFPYSLVAIATNTKEIAFELIVVGQEKWNVGKWSQTSLAWKSAVS